MKSNMNNGIRFGRKDNDEPVNGPVKTYFLSKEEIARRYGPPVKTDTNTKQDNMEKNSKKPKLTRDYLAQQLKTKTVGQLAVKHKVPKQILFRLIDKYGIVLDEKQRLAEDKEVDVDMVSKSQQARDALPKEKLGMLLASGITQSAIAKEHNLEQWQVSLLKTEYWPSGYDPAVYKPLLKQKKQEEDAVNIAVNEITQQHTEPAAQQAAPVAVINSESNSELMTANTANMETEPNQQPVDQVTLINGFDLSGMEWVKPKRGNIASDVKVLRIKKKSVILSSAVGKALSQAKFAQIGIKDNLLVIVPVESEKDAYKLGSNGNKSNATKIGGGNLIKNLVEHGFDYGDYELQLLDNGWLLTTKKDKPAEQVDNGAGSAGDHNVSTA